MLISGEAEGIGEVKGRFHAKESQNNSLLSEALSIPSQQDALVRVAKLVTDSKVPTPDAIVHGGPKLRQHCLIDGPVLQQLEMFCYSVPKQIAAMIAALGGIVVGSLWNYLMSYTFVWKLLSNFSGRRK